MPCSLSTFAGKYLSSESNTTCSFRSDTKGIAPKITTTIKSSVSSNEPGIDWLSSFLPPTSKNVNAMMAKSAVPASKPQKVSNNFFKIDTNKWALKMRLSHLMRPHAIQKLLIFSRIYFSCLAISARNSASTFAASFKPLASASFTHLLSNAKFWIWFQQQILHRP